MGQCEDTQTAQSAHMDCQAQLSPSQVSSADLLEESQHCLMHLQDTGGPIFEESSITHHALENLTALATGQDKVPRRRTTSHPERSEGKAKRGTPLAKRSIDSHSSRSSNGHESTINDEEAQRRLACPFFKHNPSKHVTERTCTGPGWSSVHRLKQHLFRRHMLLQNKSPATCPPKSERTPIDGIGPTQEKQLRSRQRQTLSQEERWFEIFHILFPHVDASQYPSPYYEYNAGLPSSSSDSSNLESEITLILQKRLKEVTGCITQRVLNSLPSQTQVDPAVSRRKDAPRKLEPDMKKEIERLCDDEHTRATQAIVMDVLRYVQGRKIEISERQQETTSESSHLQANFSTHRDMLYLPTEEDMEGFCMCHGMHGCPDVDIAFWDLVDVNMR
ncbi:hypothetical protein SCUP234_06005 [Seiridium cupressi]